MSRNKYDATVARMAGNIAAALVDKLTFMTDNGTGATAIAVDTHAIAFTSVALTRAVMAEVLRTEPAVVPECGENIAGTKRFCGLPAGHSGVCLLSEAR